MHAGKIVWMTLKQLARQAWAPLDEEPEPPDHKPHFILRDGVPDLCCERHRLYPNDR
jgi:hypothetical protein